MPTTWLRSLGRLGLGALCGSILLSACQTAAPPRPSVSEIEVCPTRAALTSTDLRRHAGKCTVVIPGSPVYPSRPFEYDAVPMDAFLSPGEIPGGMHLRFECAHGFATSILASGVLSRP